VFNVHETLFYCVANMPGAVPNTSTYALTNVTLPYAVAIADRAGRPRRPPIPALALGVNTVGGELVYEPVAEAHGLSARPLAEVLAELRRGTGSGGRQHRRRRDRSAASRAVDAYLDHLAVERGLAANSLSSYRRDLRRYLRHLDGAGVDALDAVAEQHVAGFLAALREGDDAHPPLAASSAGRAVVAVRGLHRFAVREGLATSDPAAEVRPPAPARRLPKAITVEQVEALLEAAGFDQTPLALRDRALLEVLYGTGARISEAWASTSTTSTSTAEGSGSTARGASSGWCRSARTRGLPSTPTWSGRGRSWRRRVEARRRCS
jgi:hypothetical protein